MEISRQMGIHVVRDTDAGVLKNECGRSYYNGEKWAIVYDDSMPCTAIRYTLAHELGHIFLGHPLSKKKYMSMGNGIYKAECSERQADYFAERLLCPACVLWALELESAEQIAELCQVELSVAERRYKRLEELRKKGKFLTHPLERELLENFIPYIESIEDINEL